MADGDGRPTQLFVVMVNGSADASVERHRATVLVVDDDADIRESIELLLADEGYAVVTAGDGTRAVEQLERHGRPCLILLDLIMPGMDGRAFLERLGQDPRFSQTPVVIVSAGSIVHPPRGYPVLTKPIAWEALLAVLEKHCPRPQTRDSVATSPPTRLEDGSQQ